jgi:hypothetical protein
MPNAPSDGHRPWSEAWLFTETCALLMLRSEGRFFLAPQKPCSGAVYGLKTTMLTAA